MFVLRRCDRPAILVAAGLGLAAAFTPAASAGEAAPAAGAAAQAGDSAIKSVFKKANMATDDVGHPQDFVIKSRPEGPSDYVPVFRKNEEHKTKVLTPDQLKAMEADLDTASAHHAHIRDAFPPARRAYQQEQRDQARKGGGQKRQKPGGDGRAIGFGVCRRLACDAKPADPRRAT